MTGESQDAEIEQSIKDYSNKYNKFATRMRASLKGEENLADVQVAMIEDNETCPVDTMISQETDKVSPARINLTEVSKTGKLS